MLHVAPPSVAPVAPVAAPTEAPHPYPHFNYPEGYTRLDRRTLESYASLLFYERRLVCQELYPDLGARAEDFMVEGNAGSRWHFGSHDNRPWNERPAPSSRATAVLGLVGVGWMPDREPDWTSPLDRYTGERPLSLATGRMPTPNC